MSEGEAIGYARVSKEEQARGGVSLEEQAAAIRNYCAQNGLRLRRVVTDPGISGATFDRPGLREVFIEMGLQRLRPPALDDTADLTPSGRRKRVAPNGNGLALVATMIDRIGRDAYDLMGLERAGVFEACPLHLIRDHVDTRTADGRFFWRMKLNMAQYERERTAERTSRTLQHLIATGKHIGQAPYGWRVSRCEGCQRAGGMRMGSAVRACSELATCGRLVEVPDEQAVMTELRIRRDEGATLEELAGAMDARMVPRPKGGKWTRTAVRTALQYGQDD